MGNFKQICRLSADRETGQVNIKIRVTTTGKEVYSGQVYWNSGKKNKEGKTKYGNLFFITWDKTIYERFLANPKEAFAMSGNLIPNDYINKKGVEVRSFEYEIHEATIHKFEEKKPVDHWQEKKESDSINWSDEDQEIPF